MNSVAFSSFNFQYMLRLGNRYPSDTNPCGEKAGSQTPLSPAGLVCWQGALNCCAPCTALADCLCRQRTVELLCRSCWLTVAVLSLASSSPVFLGHGPGLRLFAPFCLLGFAHPGLGLSDCFLTLAIRVLADPLLCSVLGVLGNAPSPG